MTTLTAGVAGAGRVAPETPVRPGPRGAGAWRYAVLGVLGLYFVVPIAASVWFTIRDRGQGGITAEHYVAIPGADGFADAFTRSLLIAALNDAPVGYEELTSRLTELHAAEGWTSRSGSSLAGAIRAVAEGGSVIDPKVVEGLFSARAREERSPLNDLTARERDVLREMAEGKNNAAIAATLFLAERSVEKVIHSIFLKLGLAFESAVHKRVKAVILYLADGG